jgi:hypothetical protein
MTDVSEVHTASIIRATMKTVCSSGMSAYFNMATSAIFQKAIIFTLAAVGTGSLN